MIIAVRLFRDRRRAILWWLLGVLALVGFTVALYPAVQDQTEMEDMLRRLPDAFKNMVGYDVAVPITSPAGYLHARLFATVGPVLVLIFGIGTGAQAIGGLEESGLLEPMLANPVTRSRLAVERFLAGVALLAVLVLVFAAAVLALAAPAGALDGVSVTGLAGACLAMAAMALLHQSLAFAVGAATGRRGPAIGVAATLAVGGYLVHTLLPLVEPLAPLRFVTPWYWYLQRNMLADGVPIGAFLAPVLVSAVFFVAGWSVFTRRDLR